MTRSNLENLNLNEMAETIFNSNKEVGWWSEEDISNARMKTPENKYTKQGAMLIASKLALVHSEVSEALEGTRKGLKDDHLPHRDMFVVELADTVIRILDLCGARGLDIDGAVKEKYAYNKQRADHKIENRSAAGGKTI